MTDVLHIHTDGGARGNPGPAAIGVVGKTSTGKDLFSFSKTIGITTNNVAEYRAVIEALTHIKNIRLKGVIKVYLDSQVVAKQLQGEFKVKEEHLRSLLYTVREIEKNIGSVVTYHFIPREKNTAADELLNQELNKVAG